jgi:uncharacterized membrane protein/uncharacterized BrkB/YihY/UPF0761 family membrane protein
VSLLAVSVLGFLSADSTSTPADLARDTGVGGYMVSVIASAADQARGSRWVTLVLALFGMVWAGNSAVRALRLSHALVWDVELTKLRHAWEGLAAITGLTFMVGAVAVLSWKARDVSPGLGLGALLVTGLLFACVWTLVAWLLPHDGAPWWALVPGGLLGAAGVVGMHLFTVYYLAGKIESASQMYGSLGTAAAVLLWLSIFARLLIISAGLNATLWQRHERARALRRRATRPSSPPVGDGGPAAGDAASSGRSTTLEDPMATLTVWKFDDPGGADAAEQTLIDLAKQSVITIVDAATVSWPDGAKKPKTRQLTSMAGAGALSGSFWGLLFGLLFFVPLLGMAVGAAAGALGGSLTDVGIDDEFIKSVRHEVTPGTSALFLMSTDAVIDKVKDAFAGHAPQLIHTNLSDDEESKLRDVFAD